MTGPVRAVFLGSGDFAVPILDALAADPSVVLAGVVTTPARPAGRARTPQETPVARRAAALDVPTLTPDRLRDPVVQQAVAALDPGILVLADYGRIVPPALLDLAPHGALNLHPSLLPRHRGATPVPAAIAAGDATTGVSLIRMDAGIDTGPLIAQHRVPLHDDEDAATLEARLALDAARLLVDSLPGWLDGTRQARPQATTGATLTRPLRREDGRLDPTRSAVELSRQVRAMHPWPGTFLELRGERIKVFTARVIPVPPTDGQARPAVGAPSASDAAPGDLVLEDGMLRLVTSDGDLELLTVQPAGGRPMSGGELVRGRPGLLGPRGAIRAASPAVPRVQG